MGKIDFSNFLARQTSADTSSLLDWEEEKIVWLRYVDQFYAQIEHYFKDFKEKGDVVLHYREKTMREDFAGEYIVRQLEAKIKNRVVLFDPVGLNVIGAKGRIDMILEDKAVRFLLVEKESSKPEIKISMHSCETDSKPSDFTGNPQNSSLIWKIATPPPFIEFIDLNEDSFFDALLEILNA